MLLYERDWFANSRRNAGRTRSWTFPFVTEAIVQRLKPPVIVPSCSHLPHYSVRVKKCTTIMNLVVEDKSVIENYRRVEFPSCFLQQIVLNLAFALHVLFTNNVYIMQSCIPTTLPTIVICGHLNILSPHFSAIPLMFWHKYLDRNLYDHPNVRYRILRRPTWQNVWRHCCLPSCWVVCIIPKVVNYCKNYYKN